MKIVFNSEIGHIANSHALMTKKFGALIAECFRRRLDDLDAASSLNDLRVLPGKIALVSKLNPVVFAIQLGNTAVLLLSPIPAVAKLTDSFDWSTVKSVQILGVRHD